MTDPISVGWSNEDTTNAFDAIDSPYYSYGIGISGPLFAMRDRNDYIQWDNPSTQTIDIGYGKQRPFITQGFYLVNAIPIYTALGENSTTAGVHTCTPLADDGILPVYQWRMQDSGGISNTIIHQYNCKTHTLRLAVDRVNPMQANQFVIGTDRWVADNSYWMDGTTTATGYTSMMNDPVLYTGTAALGFYLDSLSVVTVNGVDITNHLLRAECNISQHPMFVYTNDATIQEEVFPVDTYETNPKIVMGCDFDFLMGIENTILEDAMNIGSVTVSATFYSAADQTYYTQWNFNNSAYYNEMFVSIPLPNDPTTRIQRLRIMCDHTSSIKTKDGISTLPTFQ